MPFLLTKYVYPIDKPTNKFGNNICFDNPRNSMEIEEISNFLKNISTSTDDCNICTEEYLIKYLTEFLEINNLDINLDTYSDIYHKLASIWVIVRFDSTDNIDFPDLLEASIEKAVRILDFICFVSFKNLGRLNDTFLINDSTNFSSLHMKKFNANLVFHNLYMAKNYKSYEEDDDCWYFPFSKVLTRINSKIPTFETFINDTKFNYIAEQIYRLNNLTYQYDKIVCLVSLIELLIAHKPDSNKFNVEESIKKMFINKTLLILYLNNNKININHIKKELSYIYDIRSDISHGNFDDLFKVINKIRNLYTQINLFDSLDNEDFPNNEVPELFILDTLIHNLKNYLKILLDKYLNDENFLTIIKDI
jgi:hypothetical protein